MIVTYGMLQVCCNCEQNKLKPSYPQTQTGPRGWMVLLEEPTLGWFLFVRGYDMMVFVWGFGKIVFIGGLWLDGVLNVKFCTIQSCLFQHQQVSHTLCASGELKKKTFITLHIPGQIINLQYRRKMSFSNENLKRSFDYLKYESKM